MTDEAPGPRGQSTMAATLQRLSEREMERLDAEKEARARVIEAMNRFTNACAELQQLRRSQDMEFKVLKTQMEKQSRDNAYSWRLQAQKAQKELCEQLALAEAAKNRKCRAEAHEKILADKVAELEAQLGQRLWEQDNRMRGLDGVLQSRVDQVQRQNDERVCSILQHSQEACETSVAAVDSLADNLQDQHFRGSVRAEGRTRFKELCGLAKKLNDYDMTNDAYFSMKGDLLSLWHTQSRTPAPSKTGGGAAITDQRMSPLAQIGSLGATMSSRSSASPEGVLALGSKSHACTGSTIAPGDSVSAKSPLHMAGTSTLGARAGSPTGDQPDEIGVLQANLNASTRGRS